MSPRLPSDCPNVAALYVDPKGPYPALGVEGWDEARDARLYAGPYPIIAHPPCGPWGPFKWRCQQDASLAIHAVAQVRAWGGVLEHPKSSGLWKHAGIPLPGEPPDAFGGITLDVNQWDWGHRALKPTRLYIVRSARLPALPEPRPGRPDTSHERSQLLRLSRLQRRLTPPDFARWLVEVAASCVPG